MISVLPYFAHALDILLIALFIYTLLLFFKRSRSNTVFIGLAVVLGLYALALLLRLELTLLALKYFVSVAAVVFVVVFQTELRRYFELLGLIGARQVKSDKTVSSMPEMGDLIRACVELAKNKCGAIIVLKGRDDIAEFVEGGVELDGMISEETILSTFYPNSPGHDGAMIISHNRINKYSAHLPLSVNFKEIGKHGTRHAAGLGMSEKTDALCIVVSEEKGTLSVCRDGKMKTLERPQDFEKEVDKFIKLKFEVRSKGIAMYLLKHNFWLKAVAVITAVATWIVYKSA